MCHTAKDNYYTHSTQFAPGHSTATTHCSESTTFNSWANLGAPAPYRAVKEEAIGTAFPHEVKDEELLVASLLRWSNYLAQRRYKIHVARSLLIFILCFICLVPPEIMQNISVFLLFYCKPLMSHGLEDKKKPKKQTPKPPKLGTTPKSRRASTSTF